jgi:hypothetical protein
VNRRGLIAGAPISWGVIEIPDWGHQMDRDRVLREAAAVGLEAYTSDDDTEALARFRAAFTSELAYLERQLQRPTEVERRR